VYSYTYDGFGNVNSVTFAESITQTGTTTHYVYDALNRLIKSYINPENPNIYSYDANGNILSKNGVGYVYDSVYKDRLMCVGNYITFEYNSSSPLFPTKIAKGNNVFNLVRNTNRLESVNDISFVYDHFKRRIKKIRGYDVTKYFYSGEILEAVEISENNNTYKFIYHYDENRKLIGFSYNNNEYVYIRDILGNIRSIYGINEGTYLVNYSYDDRGQPTIASNNTEIGNLLAQKNCILHKGYLYDFETELYWIFSRYYSPELCRWISPDSIEYLDPESINGLNLYAYCNNDPVNKYDPTGRFAITLTTLLIGGLIAGAIGAGIGLGTAVYKDVKEDGVWFNGDWTDYVGRTLGGFVSGFGVGICTVLGAGVGVAALGGITATLFTSTGLTLSLGSALGIGSGVAFATGMAGYAVRIGISKSEDFKVQNMFIEGGFNAVSGALSVLGGYLGGMAGVHNTVFTKLLSQKGDFWLRLLVENVFTAGFKLTNALIKPYFMI
ncbi:MAG: RHS repeat-associated core domain-containing protein, partial [Candidatus Onthovivens sp.]|nr:RHS repeat-associated core domain-containing protein [Candidatus Onthovivens sp.]